MATAEAGEQHFLQQFYAGMAATAGHTLLIAKEGTIFRRTTKRQAAAWISRFVRALHANGIQPETRIAFQAASDHRLWIAEWGVLANHCVAVIVPQGFSARELIGTLAESKCQLAIVDKLTTATAIANARLPDLTHILCFEGEIETTTPVLSWDNFMESGERTADRSGSILRSIAAKDTAILFYYKDDSNILRATRYTHALLFQHAQEIDALLGNASTIHGEETVLTITAWEHVIGHIVSCYIPVLKGATVQIAQGTFDPCLFENHPHIAVVNGAYLETLKQYVMEHVKQSGGAGGSKELDTAVAFHKVKYESGKLNMWQRVAHNVLQKTVIRNVQALFGGKLRLFISVDDSVRYETQLFFGTFGVELIELPPDILG